MCGGPGEGKSLTPTRNPTKVDMVVVSEQGGGGTDPVREEQGHQGSLKILRRP